MFADPVKQWRVHAATSFDDFPYGCTDIDMGLPASQSDAEDGPSYYQLERERLISDISAQLGKLISNVNACNRRLEANIAVGEPFRPVSQLWHEYGRVMAVSTDATPVSTTLPPVRIQPDGDTTVKQASPNMSMVPGAGSTSYMR